MEFHAVSEHEVKNRLDVIKAAKVWVAVEAIELFVTLWDFKFRNNNVTDETYFEKTLTLLNYYEHLGRCFFSRRFIRFLYYLLLSLPRLV
jgi:hypothetical protein